MKVKTGVKAGGNCVPTCDPCVPEGDEYKYMKGQA